MQSSPRTRLPVVVALLVLTLMAGSTGLRIVPAASVSVDAVLTAGADMASERSDPSSTKVRRPRPTDDVFHLTLLPMAAALVGLAALLHAGSSQRPAAVAPARLPTLLHARRAPRRGPPGS